MIIFGKLIGGFFGYLIAGPVGALIGAIIGHYFDKGLASNMQAMSPEALALAQDAFFTTTFSLMGRLAKADGRVSEQEINQTELLMTQMGLSEQHRREAIDLFKKGASGDIDKDNVFEQFQTHCAPHANLKQMLLVYLISIALADGELHVEEQKMLHEIGTALNFSPRALDELLSRIQAQEHFAGEQYHGNQADALQFAYQALGVNASDDMKVIKKAWRRLMSEHHPDKLIAQGLPDDMIRIATEKSQEIQSAFDLIKKQRKK